MIEAITFIIIFLSAITFFGFKVSKIRRNILLGRDINLSGNKAQRFKTMMMVAFGQWKMAARPIPFIMHFFIYAAFVITQIELIEIIIDGASGQHRFLWHQLESTLLAPVYTFTINFIEVLSVLAFIATITFLSRRNIIRLARF